MSKRNDEGNVMKIYSKILTFKAQDKLSKAKYDNESFQIKSL